MALTANVIVPLAAPKAYSYLVPDEYAAAIKVGMRVEVQFGRKKVYSGLVKSLGESDSTSRMKPILHLLDDQPIVHEQNLSFWEWIGEYYMCTTGEVMLAALPTALKMSSETVIVKNAKADSIPSDISDDAYMIAEALEIQSRLKMEDARGIINKKSVLPYFQELINAEYAFLEEEIKEKYKPRLKQFIRLHASFRDESMMGQLFEMTSRSEKQTRALLAYFQEIKKSPELSKEELIKVSSTDHATIKALEHKGVFELFDKRVSRVSDDNINNPELNVLSDYQHDALDEIKSVFSENKPCLLRGITGSGKTRIYQELIREVFEQGGQVLYLLPEISLTSQMEQRLRELYGPAMMVYHSRLNANKRVEIWKKMFAGQAMVVGARSALLLPFKNLKLIIVDEEHDASYKQQDPAPRYHAKDAAIYLAHKLGARVILGSATPSIESMYLAKSGKFGYVQMLKRFGDSVLPIMEIVDMTQARKQLKTASVFSMVLLEEIEKTLNKKEKVILFQNRRGFSPILECDLCNWRSECIHCDVSLTLHKFSNALKCHYCGYQTAVPDVCPDCGSNQLSLKGFGTEKIEEEILAFFPEVKVGRLDADTARSKTRLEGILDQFESGDIDILVGTQMITKGLDFDNVGLVGVLSADQSLHYPDFRASERTFQLITQVSGRSGRREKRGLVIIQAQQTGHPVIAEILDNDFDAHFTRELSERRQFAYPPFTRLIQITLKHADYNTVEKAAIMLAHGLKSRLGERLLGPAAASVPRVNNKYIFQILIKLEKKVELIDSTKRLIGKGIGYIAKQKGMSTVRVSVDVDPI